MSCQEGEATVLVYHYLKGKYSIQVLYKTESLRVYEFLQLRRFF